MDISGIHQKKQVLKALLDSKGMSLVEILVVLTLIGLAGTFITGKVFDSLQEGRVQSAKITINSLGDRLKDFRRHCGWYPTTEMGLQALIEKPTSGKECKRYRPDGYLEEKRIPNDPWDNEYVYESNGKTYKIISFGSDGEEGGEDWASDIDSTKF